MWLIKEEVPGEAGEVEEREKVGIMMKNEEKSEANDACQVGSREKESEKIEGK